MRVLVTGGSGYIGSHTVRRLAADGVATVVVDRVAPPAALLPAIESFVQGDIRAPGVLERAFDRAPVDAVIHLAAEKSVEESMREPGRYFDSIVRGTTDVLEAMRRARVGSIVFSSTCAVYGNAERIPIDEDTPTRPENPYGASKLMAEDVLDWYARCHRLRSLSLRYFNAAGAAPEGDLGEDAAEAANLVPRVMNVLLGEAPALTVFGADYPTPDGTAIRDYIHVVDLAAAHVLALLRLVEGSGPGEQGADGRSQVVNLGSGSGSSVRQVVAMAEEVSGRSVPVVFGPRRAGDPVALWSDNARAREVLGWEPRHGLRDIVESAWRWHARLAGR